MYTIESAIDSIHHEDFNLRNVTLYLGTYANTPDQKRAVEELKNAYDHHSAIRCVGKLKRAFLNGTPDKDGWPRSF